MNATTTRRFNFYKGEEMTSQSSQRLEQFISDHLDIKTIDTGWESKGKVSTLMSTIKITITIDYERKDTKNGN